MLAVPMTSPEIHSQVLFILYHKYQLKSEVLKSKLRRGMPEALMGTCSLFIIDIYYVVNLAQRNSQFFHFLVEIDELEQAESVVSVFIEQVNHGFCLALVKAELPVEDRVRLV